MTSAPEFLVSVFSRYKASEQRSRPFVTLTFAQSIDAKIAGKNGKQLILSGKESMVMTHWMRTMHDAILVGIGTALNDDPQLNARHLPPRVSDSGQAEHNNSHHLPRPVILDSQLRLSPTCKLLRNYQNGQGRRPWVICTSTHLGSVVDRTEWQERFQNLERAGARILQIPDQLSIPNILRSLHDMGVRTLMVEGGARVISSFLSEEGQGNIDSIIVTVAPTLVGDEGVGYGVSLGKLSTFEHASTQILGKDTVMTMTSVSGISVSQH